MSVEPIPHLNIEILASDIVRPENESMDALGREADDHRPAVRDEG